MRLLGAVRQRAKWIEAEADTLLAEHRRNVACAIACDMKRRANHLSATLYWHAIVKLVRSRAPEGGADISSPLRETNCISCLVEKISGTRESGEPPNLRACVSCLTRGKPSRPVPQQAQMPHS